jgi:hypothetical protein
MNELLRADLAHAFTAYDRRQEKRADYNRYALARYLEAADEIATRVAQGESLDSALRGKLNGRLLASVQKTMAKNYKGLV